MNDLENQVWGYLDYCRCQKRLDRKTLKAYRIDLGQFCAGVMVDCAARVTPSLLEDYISLLHNRFKPKTVRRKIASLKAFFHYLEFKDQIEVNPFNKVQIKFREPVILPKTIPLHTIETLLSTMYKQRGLTRTKRQERFVLRDIAVIEMLFATGMRISELCSLKPGDIDLHDGNVLIYGKGAKERLIHLGSEAVVAVLEEYAGMFKEEIERCGYFYVNRIGKRLAEQSVRVMINKYTKLAAIELHITPHMFRHSFATSLLEADVDIRYIQEMLGHSSINVTEVYTHVAMAKQKDILSTKHPRRGFRV